MPIQLSQSVIRAVFAFFAFFLCCTASFSQTLQPVAETCNNGIDDDDDGLIDVYDLLDCPGIPLEACTDTVRSHNFDIQLAWEAPDNFRVMDVATPVVGNLNPNQDSVPEIVLFKNNQPYGTAGTAYEVFIFKGDGSNQANPNQLTVPTGIATDGQIANTPVIADLDADGNPELVILCADKRIRIYHDFNPAAVPCMNLWVTALDTCLTGGLDVYAADFNNDGISELYAGNEVYVLDLSVPAMPTLRRRLRGTGPMGRIYWTGFTPKTKGSSFAADLLSVADCNGDPDCAGLEIAAGNVIYSVDIDPNDGDGYEIKIQRNINTLSGEQFFDGMTTVADVNLDGVPEVLVTSRKGTENGFYIWNKTGYWRFFKALHISPDWIIGSKLVVGNVYDDRQNGFTQDLPEILACDEGFLNCYNLNRASVSPAAPYWWQYGIQNIPFNGIHTPALFDFDLDGRPEIVFNNLELQGQFLYGLAVLYGGAAPFPPHVDANRRLMLFPAYAAAASLASPVIADVDADGQAEIVSVGTRNYFNITPIYRLHVLEAEEIHHSTWPSARQVWNQYNYNIVNVNDDLSIPKNQQPDYVEIPGPGSGYRPLNMFNGQLPYYGFQHPKHLTTADATVEVLEVICLGNLQFRVKLRVCNQGSIALPPALPVTIYRDGNPLLGPATSMGTFLVATGPIVPGGCAELTAVLPYTFGNLYAVVNDPAINIFPLHDSDQFWKAECDYSNNAAVFKTNPLIGPSLSLGPDIHDCTHGAHLLQASPGFASYVWQNGTTGPYFTTNTPGTYWVEAKDFCVTTRRDTIRIIADTVLQHLQVSACSGTAYTFNGVAVAAGTSHSFVYSTMAGCDSTIVVTVAATAVNQTAETVRICPGDSALVFGNWINTAGIYNHQYVNSAGCDSTYVVHVELYNPPMPTNELRSLCPGDSTVVFGNVVTVAGVYAQQLSNINGCDSTHTVTVSVFAAPTSTTENRQICAGDSTIVFGNVVQTAGVYNQIFAAANGCDSTHTVTVSVYAPVTPTAETRLLCPGDSTIVFGNIVYAAGVFAQSFSNVNGCDSTHTINVSLLPIPPSTVELRSLCPGDSVQIYGSYVHTAGNYIQHYSSATGCDSIHIVTVNLFAAPVPTQENRQICSGDSTVVFGNVVYAAGVFTQNFTNANGCDSTHTVTVSQFTAPVPTQENRQICSGDSTIVFGNTVYMAGVFTQNFTNVNGCDSAHTVTVSLFNAPVPTQENRAICAGDSTLVFGNYVAAPGAYVQHFSNVNGCDSVHTINVGLLPGPVPSQETRSLCPGDSTLVFGQYVSAPGVYTRHFPGAGGCDSLHIITVTLFTAPAPSSEQRQICPGDSTLVFGQYVHTGGVFNYTFANATGCDSLHTVTVSLYTAAVPTQETHTICPGDSIFVFGAAVHAAGAFTQTFSDIHGCDSTHIIIVNLYAMPTPTQEIRLLCAGDSTLVFGNYVNVPGTYNQMFTNVNGCDSTHTVEVVEAFLLEQHDTLALCPGDSAQVFGTWVHTPATVQQIVPGIAGCDTLYTVTIRGVEAPAVAPEITQPDAQRATGSITVPAGTSALYSLSPLHFDSQTVFDNLLPGDYVLYQQFAGCLQSFSVRIVPFNRPKSDGLYAPNVILPGSSNDNGVFTLYAPTDSINQLVYLRIYDRWGTLVFEREHIAANDASKGWDGYIGRKPAAVGVYVWQALVEFKNGERVVKKGDVTVVR